MHIDTPSWYWTKGLHDAKITSWKVEKFHYDYSQPKPIRNCITVELDTRIAMFDTTIKAIKFLNAKITQGDIPCVDWFWKSDNIKNTDKGYELEITLSCYPDIKKVKIIFEQAVIER